jgi:hypothetical protein
VKALEHTGDSANIAFYGEPNTTASRQVGRVWVEVLRKDSERIKREWVPCAPRFQLTVYVVGTGEVADFTYRPRNEVPAGRLDPKVVTAQVRAKAGAKIRAVVG